MASQHLEGAKQRINEPGCCTPWAYAKIVLLRAPYRAAPAAPGLPFSRRRLRAATAIVCVFGAATALFPLVVTASDPRITTVALRSVNGVGMRALGLLGVLIAVAVTALGVLAVRGKRVPAGALLAIPALPVLVGAAFVFRDYGQMKRALALSGRTLDGVFGWEDSSRLLALGLTEIACLDLFASLSAAFASAAAGAGLLGGAVTVDRRRAPPASSWLVPTVLGALAALSIVAPRVVLGDGIGRLAIRLPALGVVVTGTVLVALAARNAVVARAWHDEREAKQLLASILTGTLAIACSALLFERASRAALDVDILPLTAMRSMDPMQRFAILRDVASSYRVHAISACVEGALLVSAAIVAMLGGVGRGRHPVTRSLVPGLAALALAAVVVAVSWLYVRSDQTREASMVELPRIPAPLLRSCGAEPLGAPIVLRSGARAVVPAGGSALVHADRELSIEQVRSELAAVGSAPVGHWSFALASEVRGDVSQLGDLAVFLPSRSLRLSFENPRVMEVANVVTAKVGNDGRLSLSLSVDRRTGTSRLPDADGTIDESLTSFIERSGDVHGVRLVVPPGMTIEEVLRASAAMQTAIEAQETSGAPAPLVVGLTTDTPELR